MLYPVSGAGPIPVATQSSTENIVQLPNVSFQPLSLPMYQPYAVPPDLAPLYPEPQFSQLQHISSPEMNIQQFVPHATATQAPEFPPLHVPVTLALARHTFRPASPPAVCNDYNPNQMVISPFIPSSQSPSSNCCISPYPNRTTSPNFWQSMPFSTSPVSFPIDGVLLESEEVFFEDEFETPADHDNSFEQRARKHGIQLNTKAEKVGLLQARNYQNKKEIINKKTQTFQEKAAMHGIVIESPDLDRPPIHEDRPFDTIEEESSREIISNDKTLPTEWTEDSVGILGNQVLFTLQSLKSPPPLEMIEKCRETASLNTHYPNNLKKHDSPVRCYEGNCEVDLEKNIVIVDECEKSLIAFIDELVYDVFDNAMEHFINKANEDYVTSPESVTEKYVLKKSVYTWNQDKCNILKDKTCISSDKVSDMSLKLCKSVPEFGPKNTLVSLAVTGHSVNSPEVTCQPTMEKCNDTAICSKSQEFIILSQEKEDNSEQQFERIALQSSHDDLHSEVKSSDCVLLQSTDYSSSAASSSDLETNRIQELHGDQVFDLLLCDNKESPKVLVDTFKRASSESSLLRPDAPEFSVYQESFSASIIPVSNSPFGWSEMDEHEHVDFYSLRPDAPEFHLPETVNNLTCQTDDISSIGEHMMGKAGLVQSIRNEVTVQELTDGTLRADAPVFCSTTCTSTPSSISQSSAEVVVGDPYSIDIFPSAYPLPHAVAKVDLHPHSKDTSVMRPSAPEFRPKNNTEFSNEHRMSRPIRMQREFGTMTTENFTNQCCVCECSFTGTDTIKQKFVNCQRQLLELRAEIVLKDLNKQLAGVRRQKEQWQQLFSSTNNDVSLSSMVDSKASSLELQIDFINDRLRRCEQQLDRGIPLDDLPEFTFLDPAVSDTKIQTQEEELTGTPELNSGDTDYCSNISEYDVDPSHDLHNGKNEMNPFDYYKENDEMDIQTRRHNTDYVVHNTKTTLEGLAHNTIEILDVR